MILVIHLTQPMQEILVESAILHGEGSMQIRKTRLWLKHSSFRLEPPPFRLWYLHRWSEVDKWEVDHMLSGVIPIKRMEWCRV